MTKEKRALLDMVLQFAYGGHKKGVPIISTGGLSALETAFDVLRLPDPCPLAEFMKRHGAA